MRLSRSAGYAVCSPVQSFQPDLVGDLRHNHPERRVKSLQTATQPKQRQKLQVQKGCVWWLLRRASWQESFFDSPSPLTLGTQVQRQSAKTSWLDATRDLTEIFAQ